MDRRSYFLLGIALEVFSFVAAAAGAGAAPAPSCRLKKFPETVSPDGVYTLAWGDPAPVPTQKAGVAAFVEVPYAVPWPALANMPRIQDYVVENRRGKPPLA